jgi:hypothetical protein
LCDSTSASRSSTIIVLSHTGPGSANAVIALRHSARTCRGSTIVVLRYHSSTTCYGSAIVSECRRIRAGGSGAIVVLRYSGARASRRSVVVLLLSD